MKILIVTDAWEPQINGVVRVIQHMRQELAALSHEVTIISPNDFLTFPLSFYPEIRLAVFPYRKLARQIKALQPDMIHIATEGPLGFAARRYCLKHKLKFTTDYHTKFPEYIAERFPIPKSWSYAVLRRFHDKAERTLVGTETVRQELQGRGFNKVQVIKRGVDTNLFHPRAKDHLDYSRPVLLYVGRIAVEKNLEAFLDLDIEGTKVIVGDGPLKQSLQDQYPAAHFLGVLQGEALAAVFAASDVFVFPSRTDTLALVLMEALASGLPVAAYPVAGPLDIIGNSPVGVLDEDLAIAVQKALLISPAACREYALQFSWQAAASDFLTSLTRAT